MALSSTSLAVSVAHAVTFLSRSHSLATLLAPAALAALQSTLEANLAAAFLSTWVPSNPTQGSGRRVLAFAPDALPPRPVYKACVSVGVEPRIFAAREFELMVDPGLVSVRVPGNWGLPSTTSVVWSAQPTYEQQRVQAPRMPQPTPVRGHRSQSSSISSIASFDSSASFGSEVALKAPQPKTLAQRLMEHDAADEDILFSDLAAASGAAAWKAPASNADAFKALPLSFSTSNLLAANGSGSGAPSAATGAQLSLSASISMPMSVSASGGPVSGPYAASRAAIGHSRSSSRSSVSSGAFSLLSDDSLSTCASLSSVSTSLSSLSLGASSTSSGSSGSSGTAGSTGNCKRNRRVFVDATKTDVTPYDGGKTTVLTGGVMLGAGPSAPRKQRMPRF